ncbi:MAG TPA: hypothetical protein VFZ00_11215 [Solirubrobacter sp.]|nr:hypothetical protein [Solirubrobacter sp.]
MAGPTPQNFVSQGKVFVDMPGPKGFAGQLLTVTKIDAKEDGSVDVVTTVGVDQGAGWREKQGGYKLTLTVVRTVGQQEVDWFYAKLTKKVFTLSTEDEGNGVKLSYLCRVSKADPGSDNQGVNETEIELAAITRTPDA